MVLLRMNRSWSFLTYGNGEALATVYYRSVFFLCKEYLSRGWWLSVPVFFVLLQELRVPCLVIDAIVVFGLHRWEAKLKADKALLDADAIHQANVKHETDKRNITSLKAGERAQRKAEEKKLHNTTGKNANFAPTNHIQQPDKNTKKKM